MPRIVMADDHAPMRAMLRDSLASGGFEICAEAADADGAIEAALACKPDVVLLDIHMPGGGIRVASQLSRALPDTAIVMLTSSKDEADLFDSLRAGASGYLLKDTDPERLPNALRGVLSGEAAIPRTLVSRILDEFKSRPPRRFARKDDAAAKLTSREWEVMELLGQGVSTDEVARRLFLSPTTVRVHVSTVLRKLRAKDRRSALAMLRKT
jgi:DNA-binding NarL/FixJ family response regulator